MRRHADKLGTVLGLALIATFFVFGPTLHAASTGLSTSQARTAAPVAVGAANAEGTSLAFARADHVHSIGSAASVSVTNITTSYSALSTDALVQATALTADTTVTLPTAASVGNGKTYIVKDGAGKAGDTWLLLVATSGSDTIESNTKRIYLTHNYGFVRLVSDGTSNWVVIDTPQNLWSPDPRVASVSAVVWLDANRKVTTTVTTGGNTVSGWTDLTSGNAFSVIGCCNSPFWGPIGGSSRNAIHWGNSGNEVFQSGTAVVNNSGGATSLTVAARNPGGSLGWFGSNSPNRALYGHGVTAGVGFYNHIPNPGSALFEVRGNGTASSATTATGGIGGSGSEQTSRKAMWVVITVRQGTSSGIWFNDINETTAQVNATVGNINAPFVVGARDTTPNETFDGAIGEQIYFAGSVPDAELAFLRRCLIKKWDN